MQHIVVIDADRPTRAMLVALLTQEGYAPLAVAPDAHTLPFLRRCRPDAVILDLPFTTPAGQWETVAQLRGDSSLRSLPLVVCSTDHAALHAPAEALSDRRIALLPKPFDDLDDVIAALVRLTGPLVSSGARRGERGHAAALSPRPQRLGRARLACGGAGGRRRPCPRRQGRPPRAGGRDGRRGPACEGRAPAGARESNARDDHRHGPAPYDRRTGLGRRPGPREREGARPA